MSPSLQVARLRVRLSVRRLEDRTVPSTSIPLNAYNWTALGPAPINSGTAPGNLSSSGRVAAIAAHPTNVNILYVGAASGGVWKTTNANSTNPTWTPLTDGQAALTTGDIALAPSDPNIIYVATGEPNNSGDSFYGRGVLKSTDAGATWSLFNNNGAFDRRVSSRIVVHPTDPNTVYVALAGGGVNGFGGNCGVWRTTNGGTSWTNITSGTIGATSTAFTDFELDPADPNTGYCAVGATSGAAANGVYKSTNLLAASPTWTRITALPNGTASLAGRTLLSVARNTATAQTVVYAAYCASDTFALLSFWQSTDSGATWTQRTATPNPLGGQGWYDFSLLADKNDATGNTVIMGGATGSNRLIRSTNGGTSWSSLIGGGNGPHVDHHALAIDANGRIIDGDDGGVYRLNSLSPITWVSLNGATSGTATPTALNTVQFVGVAMHPTNANIVVGGTQDNGEQRFNDNLGWTTVEGGDGGRTVWDLTTPTFVYRCSPVGSYGVNSWVRRSTNSGTSFSSIVTGIVNPNNAAFYAPMAIDPAPGSHRVFLGTNVVNVLADGTVASPVWSQYGVALPSTSSIVAIGIGASNPNTLYVSNGGSIFVTTNGGASWQTRTPPGGDSFFDFAVDPTNSNVAYVVTASFTGSNRVWRTINAGQTWTSIQGSGLPNVPAYSVVLDPGPTTAVTDDVLFVGNDMGVYRSGNLGGLWVRYGALLPNVQIRDLDFNPSLGILAAGTYGRGVWEIATNLPGNSINGSAYIDSNANGVRNPGEPGQTGRLVYVDNNNDGTFQAPVTDTFTQPSPAPILDTGTVTTSTLDVTVPNGRVVTDVNVTLNITHPRVSDLSVSLVSPAGTRVLLFNAIGGLGQNFVNTVLDDSAATPIGAGTAPFTGTFRPAEMLSAFVAQQGTGTWTLEITDMALGEVGTIENWSMAIASGELSTSTDSSGNYRLTGLPAGTYFVREVPLAGFRPTGPALGFHVADFPTAASPAAIGNDFGSIADSVAPTITGAVPSDPNPSSAPSVTYSVSFSEAVVGLTASNFALATTGVAGAAVLGVNGSGTTYFVTVGTGVSDGTIQLRLANSTGLTDLALNPVSNVPFDGGTYVMLRGSPTATFAVNDGVLTQRSRVTFLTMTFSEEVTFVTVVADAFTLQTQAGATVPFTAAAQNVGGRTVVTITPTGNVTFGSLDDGRYVLTLIANAASDIEGNFNAQAVFEFFRLYGDTNGDAVVNAFDFAQFRTTFGSSIGEASYRDWLDYDGDGVINAFDFSQFRIRFGLSLP